jgi:hypothetical protein
MAEPIISENLKYLKPAWAKSVHYLPYPEIFKLIDSDMKGFRQTTRSVEFETDFDARDMAWNHMDFTHRPWIHKHYTDGLRMAIGQDVCFGFTPFGRTPFLIPTFDFRKSEREFGQFYQIGGIFSVFMSMSIIPRGEKNIWKVEWTIVSKWYFRPLHGMLHRTIEKMNRRLFQEDVVVKKQRRELRERHYGFIKEEELDYLTSTLLHPTNVKRPAAPPLSVPVASIPMNTKHVVKTGEREFVIIRKSATDFLIWDNICPHQGARLSDGQECNKGLICAWHGLRIAALELSAAAPQTENASLSAALSGETLTITPKA